MEMGLLFKKEVAAIIKEVTANRSSYLDAEMSSLIEYLNSINATTLYSISTNFHFLCNIWSGHIPPHSSKWHPQSIWEWLLVLPSDVSFGVIATLLLALLDSCLAGRVAKKFKINPTRWSKVKMEVVLFSPNPF
jgi:hypothetical protein